jgi:hypothetical protein
VNITPELREQLDAHERDERAARLAAACCDLNGPGVDVDAHVTRIVYSLDHPIIGRRLLPPGYHQQRVRDRLASRAKETA